MADTTSKPEASDITIPVLSVLKNGLTIKTIILNIPSPPQSKSTSPPNQEDDAPILIGRHPDCQIVLDHPSISRFHLDLRANLELQRLAVTDRSSVHGTWVSGNKIQPNVPVGLDEGDTLRLGASTREYRLHWVPMSRVAELESPLPALLEEDEETHQQENMNETWVPPIPSASLMPASMGPLYAGGPFTSLLETEDRISVRKEPGEERVSICSAVPLLESAVSPLPIKEEENTSFASDAPSERNHASLPRSEKKAMSSSLLSRRSKSIGFLHVQAGIGEARARMKEDSGTGTGEGREEESLCRVLFDNMKGGEHELSDLDKENVTHVEMQNSSLSAAKLNQEEVVLHSFKENGMSDVLGFPNSYKLISGNCVDNDPEEAFASSYKENLTPITSSCRKLKKSFLGLQRSSSNDLTVLNEGEEVFANGCPKPDAPISRGRVKDDSEEPFASSYKENLTPTTSSGRKLKKRFLGLQRSSSNEFMVFNGGEEAFVSDKENVTPKVSGVTRPKKCISRSYDRIEREMIRKRVERVPFQSLLENSPSRNNNSSDDAHNSSINQAEPDCSPKQSVSENYVKINREEYATFPSAKDNLTPRASGAEKLKKSFSSSRDRIEREMTKKGAEKVPFQSLMETSSFRNSNSVDLDNLADNSFIQQTDHVLTKAAGKMKRWNIVVDTSCFLDEDSRRSIELLEGLKGTQLIIPRIVIRELDCMKGREGMFRRTTKASSVLQWIETCMVRTSWWIHVQSSLEMMPVASTPPVSPRPQLNELGIGPSNSKGFSTCASLMEIVSPTAEDHVLDCALLFKKLKNDAQFVLLTNSVTLKIKAMSEGLLCEGPTEFRQSLVNPYSKRFLWGNSCPRGSTWSCSDDQLLLPENYYHQCPVARKVAQPAEGAKGLKLILLHNSHYGKTNLVK